MKIYLLLFSFCITQMLPAEEIYQITDSLLMGYYVDKVVWDSHDTLWFTLQDDNSCLGKAYGDSVWFYNKYNSTLDVSVCDIAIDSNDTLWLATYEGLVKFDHHNFVSYDTTNSDIPVHRVPNIVIDKEGNVWMAGIVFGDSYRANGIVKFNKKDWVFYSSENSPYPSSPYSLTPYTVNTMLVDNNNNIWVSCELRSSDCSGYIIKISGDDWECYNADSIGIPVFGFSILGNNMALDSDNNLYVWLDYSFSDVSNYEYGKPTVIKYDGEFWAVLDTGSYLRDVMGIMCDNYDIVWVNRVRYQLDYYSKEDWSNWGVLDFFAKSLQKGIDSSIWLLSSKGIYVMEKVYPNIVTDVILEDNVNVYPNPTTGNVTIDCDDFAYCEVYDMMGNRLARSRLLVFDISQCGKGAYLLKIVNKNRSYNIKKVIVF